MNLITVGLHKRVFVSTLVEIFDFTMASNTNKRGCHIKRRRPKLERINRSWSNQHPSDALAERFCINHSGDAPEQFMLNIMVNNEEVLLSDKEANCLVVNRVWRSS